MVVASWLAGQSVVALGWREKLREVQVSKFEGFDLLPVSLFQYKIVATTSPSVLKSRICWKEFKLEFSVGFSSCAAVARRSTEKESLSSATWWMPESSHHPQAGLWFYSFTF